MHHGFGRDQQRQGQEEADMERDVLEKRHLALHAPERSAQGRQQEQRQPRQQGHPDHPSGLQPASFAPQVGPADQLEEGAADDQRKVASLWRQVARYL
jgi:hypothetical protein